MRVQDVRVQQARVLVIEDAEAIRVAVETGLRTAGFTVCSRADGSELERVLHSFRPDLVVLDVMLPGRDGFALLAAVRRHAEVVSKEQILIAVWGYEDYDPNLVEVHVSALRRKLGGPPLLHTVRGLGYVLRPEPP
ncbi:MAG: response regulator transcription factor [Pseudonocardiaceae bacterium]